MNKIAIIINVSIKETGVSTYIKTLLGYFEKDENVVLLLTNNSWNDFLKDKDFSTEFFNIHYSSFFYKLFVLFKLKRFGCWFFNRFNLLGYHLRNSDINKFIFPTSCYLTFFIDKTSYVSVHDLMHLTERKFLESSNFIKRIYRNNIYQNIGSEFSNIIFESEFGKNMFSEYYLVQNKCKTFILPYCCPNYVIDIIKNKSYLEHDVKKFGFYFFYPASFWSHKNHRLLIYAFHNLIKEGFDFNIVFSGGFNRDYNQLKGLVNNLGLEKRVIFTGYVNDSEIVALYIGSYALIMPTFFGPTNIPPIEAIYCDTPILISGIYGMKEQLEDAALYFDPNSIIDIEKSLLEFLKSDRDGLIKKGQNLKFKFSPELFKSNLNCILNEN